MIPGRLEAKPGACGGGGIGNGGWTQVGSKRGIDRHVAICVTYRIQEGQEKGGICRDVLLSLLP